MIESIKLLIDIVLLTFGIFFIWLPVLEYGTISIELFGKELGYETVNIILQVFGALIIVFVFILTII